MFSGQPTDARERALNRLSVAVLFLGLAAILGVGTAQLLKDGSLWRDEASVALSLLKLSPAELLGMLDGGQSFPRVYLLAIAGLKAAFGYHTLVLRALPFLFFVLGSIGWFFLLYRRFRFEPLVLVLGVLLSLIPAQWFVQAAMLKPYSFDGFLALVPFLLSDAFYTSTLERGERPWRMLLLTGLCALSYPFTLVVIARLLGWWVPRAATGRPSVHPRAGGITLGGMALSVGTLWATDLRHTTELSASLLRFWQDCVLGASDSSVLALLDRFAFGWYTGDSNFAHGGGLPEPIVFILRLAFLAGLVRIASSILLGLNASNPILATPRDWGSRSLGYAAVLCGVVCASLLASYPICAGRLTLFALLPLQIVTLEGLALGAAAARRLPTGRLIAVGALIALIAAVGPVSVRDASRLVGTAAPDDLRPALEIMRERPDLPVISTSCTVKQIETLPESVGREVLFVGPGKDLAAAIAHPEAWILHSPASYCKNQLKSLKVAASSWTMRYKRSFASRLIHVEFDR